MRLVIGIALVLVPFATQAATVVTSQTLTNTYLAASAIASGPAGSEQHSQQINLPVDEAPFVSNLSYDAVITQNNLPAGKASASTSASLTDTLESTGTWSYSAKVAASGDFGCIGPSQCSRGASQAYYEAVTTFTLASEQHYTILFDALTNVVGSGDNASANFSLEDVNYAPLVSFSTWYQSSGTANGSLGAGTYHLWMQTYANDYHFGDSLDGLASVTAHADFQLAPVPLPGAIWLLGSGLCALAATVRKRASVHSRALKPGSRDCAS